MHCCFSHKPPGLVVHRVATSFVQLSSKLCALLRTLAAVTRAMRGVGFSTGALRQALHASASCTVGCCTAIVAGVKLQPIMDGGRNIPLQEAPPRVLTACRASHNSRTVNVRTDTSLQVVVLFKLQWLQAKGCSKGCHCLGVSALPVQPSLPVADQCG